MQRLLLYHLFQHNFLEFLFAALKYIYCPVSSEVLAFIPQTNYYSYSMLHNSSNFLFYSHISRTPAVCQNEGHCTKWHLFLPELKQSVVRANISLFFFCRPGTSKISLKINGLQGKCCILKIDIMWHHQKMGMVLVTKCFKTWS